MESTARPRTGRAAVVGWSVERERGGGDGAGEGVLRALKTRRREEEKRER